MNKKQLLVLVDASYTKGKLDDKKVAAVVKYLDRKDLKSYVRALKLEEKKKQITVALPSASVYNTTKKIFFDLFPGHTVSVEEDRLLLLGGKITAGDTVYDFSLKNKLENFLLDLEQSYE